MITINSMATRIEEGLNASASAYKFKFKIFVDAGKFKEAINTRTEKMLYINSLLRVGESNIVPIKDMVVATQSAVLEVCVPIFTENQIDEATTLFRNLLDGYFAMYKVQSIDGYSVSSTYSLASTGTLEVRGNVGPSLTFYVNINFAYIQNGLNSDEITYTLDGMSIPYTSAQTTKTPTIDSNVSSDSYGKSTGRASAFVRGWDFEMPALTGVPISDLIMREMDGDAVNTSHTLVKTYGTGETAKSYTYSVIFGQTGDKVQGIRNSGLAFSLVERAPYVGE